MNAKKLFQKVVGVSTLVGILLVDRRGRGLRCASRRSGRGHFTLSADEIAGLQFMREEEKLAHDVYVTFYQQYGLAIFNNIANSEATHMAAIKTLLDQYGIADPAAGQPIGVFTNPELQALYNQLIAQGRQSLSAALKVGAAIEEIDIRDLQTRLVTTDAGRYPAVSTPV